MPVASADVWNILYTVSRYLFPLLAVSLVFLVLFFILSDSRIRREKVHHLPGSRPFARDQGEPVFLRPG